MPCRCLIDNLRNIFFICQTRISKIGNWTGLKSFCILKKRSYQFNNAIWKRRAIQNFSFRNFVNHFSRYHNRIFCFIALIYASKHFNLFNIYLTFIWHFAFAIYFVWTIIWYRHINCLRKRVLWRREKLRKSFLVAKGNPALGFIHHDTRSAF